MTASGLSLRFLSVVNAVVSGVVVAVVFAVVVGTSFSASALEEDVAYRNEMASKVKAATSVVASAASDIAKLDEIKKLKGEVVSERDRIRKELEAATEAKAPKEKVAKLDARDTEILLIYFSLEPVFEQSLSEAFSKNVEFRRKACNSLPQTVKFNDMAGLPEDAPVPVSTGLSLDLIKALCEAPSARK